MDGSDAAWPADVEFVEYVRARQHTLLRAAFLVCGDVHLAEDLLQGALVKLARRWEQVRDEAPDAYVRRILYRDAVSSWRKRRHEVVGFEPAWEEPVDTWEAEDVERRLDVPKGARARPAGGDPARRRARARARGSRDPEAVRGPRPLERPRAARSARARCRRAACR